MLIEIVLIIVTLFLLLYWYITKNFGKWESLGIPCISGRFPYGSNKGLLTRSTHHNYWILHDYKQFKDSDVYGTYLFGKPVLNIKKPELVAEILVKNFKHFVNRFDNKIMKLIDGGDLDQCWTKQLAFMGGEEWKDVRSTFSPIFTSGKMKGMYKFIKEVSTELTNQLEEKAVANQDFDLKDYFGKFSLDSLASCAFGINPNSFKKQDSSFVQNAKEIFEQSLGFMLLLFSRLLPGVQTLHKMLNINAMKPKQTKFFKDMICETIENRRKRNHRENDLIDLMLDCLKESENMEDGPKDDKDGAADEDNQYEKNMEFKHSRNHKKLDENIIVATALVLLVAGYDTTGITLSFLAYELAKNPEIQAKLQQEIDDAFENNDGEFPDYQCIQSMPYLESCLYETLRLHSVLGDIMRSCVSDCNIPGIPFTIRKNDLISINCIGIHMDETIYPNPQTFNPENFSKEARKSRSPYTFLGFGQGPRGCIGMRFALLEAKVAITQVLREFSFLPSLKNAAVLVLDPESSLGYIKGGLHAKIQRRQSEQS